MVTNTPPADPSAARRNPQGRQSANNPNSVPSSQNQASPLHRAPPNTPVGPAAAGVDTLPVSDNSGPQTTPRSHVRALRVVSPSRGEEGSTATTGHRKGSKKAGAALSIPSDADDESDHEDVVGVPDSSEGDDGDKSSMQRAAHHSLAGIPSTSSNQPANSTLPQNAHDILSRRINLPGTNAGLTTTHPPYLPPAAPAPTPLSTLQTYTTIPGLISLLITPFFQGMFYGLGEGLAKVVMGRYYGVEPVIALGGGPQSKGLERDHRRKPSWIRNLWARFTDRSTTDSDETTQRRELEHANLVAASPLAVEEGWIVSTLSRVFTLVNNAEMASPDTPSPVIAVWTPVTKTWMKRVGNDLPGICV
ncbi:hypothetical protein DFS34DRAFT_634515 [Phlyctochytrium arcticum]|nr:hypothetical protein DFS34DRAFT_634515 [Phlyctochytrium arcticum]